ncbi:MAG: biliverdin-producing heme oxygenase [Rhizobacter sp.]|nr:biliverdin-producing heme oxygenase [Rhizobacter sp.]
MKSLAEELKAGTRALHVEVERSVFMGKLLRGEMTRGAYAALLRNLWAIYTKLEAALAQASADAGVRAVLDPALERAAAIEQDLLTVHGPDWLTALHIGPACQHYLDRLDALSSTQPRLLVAHAYVRYLGDLNGGQALARIVARQLELALGDGIAFYDFGSAEDVSRLKQAFRDGLGRVARDDAEVDVLVAEARLSFELHAALFDELAATHFPHAALPA